MCDSNPYPPIVEMNCPRCGKRFGYRDESDSGGLQPDACPECKRAEAVSVPSVFEEAFKGLTLEP